MAPATDLAFEGAGQIEGLEIWRIEKLKVVPVDKATYGEFYSGDSYIVLHTKKPPKSNTLQWDIHFWLGKTTSQDEAGVAAYKTVELDDSLGGAPVQHREVQDHESRKFLSYFKKGIRYLDGGIESGFRKVERGVYQKRLLQIKGKRNVRVRQVELSGSSLNLGDVFILDDGLQIFVWNGPHSSKVERIKGVEVARNIRDEERGGKALIRIVDDNDRVMNSKFFKALGDRPTEIKSAEEGGEDTEHEKRIANEIKLYRVSDESGELKITEVESRPLKKDDLDSNDCFILEAGTSGIYAWIGQKATDYEKKKAWENAMTVIEDHGHPKWTSVCRVVEGGETPLFKQFFTQWINPNAQKGFGRQHSINQIAQVTQEKVDVTRLHKRKESIRREDIIMPDDASGDYEIWRVEGRDLVPIPEVQYGTFYSGDSYIVLYKYKQGQYIIYFWQGLKSTIDEKASSAILAAKMDDSLGGTATQVRVVQNREPEHFLRMFQGRMTILLGGVESTFGKRKQLFSTNGENHVKNVTRMLQIFGTNHYNTKSVEVNLRAASLNSDDAFVIDAPSTIYVWIGKDASEDERAMSRNVVDGLLETKTTSVTFIDEGLEPDEFWDSLGGKEPYAESSKERREYMPPRLFHCSNASGRFEVEEIVDFDQEDLIEDDVMLLDTDDEVFVWIGNGANAVEKKEALTTAMEYIRADPRGRSVDSTSFIQIKQGHEPLNFTTHFHAWDLDKWSAGKTYEEIKRELGEENAGVTSATAELEKYYRWYTYEELRRRPPPEGVDPKTKEQYLSNEEFVKVFEITKEQFNSLPKWKQVNMKKAKYLF